MWRIRCNSSTCIVTFNASFLDAVAELGSTHLFLVVGMVPPCHSFSLLASLSLNFFLNKDFTLAFFCTCLFLSSDTWRVSQRQAASYFKLCRDLQSFQTILCLQWTTHASFCPLGRSWHTSMGPPLTQVKKKNQNLQNKNQGITIEPTTFLPSTALMLLLFSTFLFLWVRGWKNFPKILML